MCYYCGMAELKTKENDASVQAFLEKVGDKQKREDCKRIAAMMEEISGYPPKMWGPSIVGYGRYHYKYDSGHEGDFFRVGFSPRKQNITIYIMPGFEHFDDQLEKLGKYSTGKSCLYIKRLSDIDLDVLETLIKESLACMAKEYPE